MGIKIAGMPSTVKLLQMILIKTNRFLIPVPVTNVVDESSRRNWLSDIFRENSRKVITPTPYLP